VTRERHNTRDFSGGEISSVINFMTTRSRYYHGKYHSLLSHRRNIIDTHATPA
jgi:hypothetical protein